MAFWMDELYTNNVKVFSGVIEKPTSKYMSLANNSKVHNINCIDWIYLADKKIVAKAYHVSYMQPGSNTFPGANTFPGIPFTAGSVVRDLLTNYLSIDGVTAGNIQEGPNISAVVYNYVPVTQCLTSLAELAGFEFDIDENKQLNFFARDTNYNDTEINELSDIINVQVEESAEDYRNKQYVRGGKGVTDSQFEYKTGDGTQKTFTLSYPLAKEPRIYVNNVSQTVGIKELETKKQWYWNKGDPIITQDENEPTLVNFDSLRIEYEGLYDMVVISYDNEEIDRMQGIEGGSGIHENMFEASDITGSDAAFETANAKLKRYAKVGTRITFTTKLDGFKAGQLIPVKLDSYGIDAEYLIESVKISELGTFDGRCIYDVSIVDGAATGSWANFFKKLANNNNGPQSLYENIQENEVLTTLQTFNKTWTSTEQPNIFAVTNPGPTLQPGPNTFPCFDSRVLIKYMSFFVNEVEFFRKPISKTTTSTGQIKTTVFVTPIEANNIDITHVGWFGGMKVTNDLNTGILIDKQPYSINKSDTQALQIDKTDIKGW
jgi:hypothetical protein